MVKNPIKVELHRALNSLGACKPLLHLSVVRCFQLDEEKFALYFPPLLRSRFFASSFQVCFFLSSVLFFCKFCLPIALGCPETKKRTNRAPRRIQHSLSRGVLLLLLLLLDVAGTT